MGALHAGHAALLARARERCASVVASVFVNPLQFSAGEDFERYPRDLQKDRQTLERAGTDLLFLPQRDALYPQGFATHVDPGEIGARFEGTARPGHFTGVATVVVKLLQIVAPQMLFLGQKDAQQTAVLRRVVLDLNVPVEIEIVPTVRENDGLALSSRNAYLSAKERAAAPALHGALLSMRSALERGASKDEAAAQARAVVREPADLAYLDLVGEEDFAPLPALSAPAFVIGAVRLGGTRLIDNLWIRS